MTKSNLPDRNVLYIHSGSGKRIIHTQCRPCRIQSLGKATTGTDLRFESVVAYFMETKTTSPLTKETTEEQLQ